MTSGRLRALLVSLVLAVAGTAGATLQAAAAPGPGQPVAVPLSGYVNNDGIGSAPGQANFDGSGYAFPAGQLPSGPVTLGGVPYLMPNPTGNDNVAAVGQNVTIPQGRYVIGWVLASSSYGNASGAAVVHYADGTSSTALLGAPDWYSSSGVIHTSYRFSPSGVDPNPVSIYATQLWFDPSRVATAITLPQTSLTAAGVASLHVFALTLQPEVGGTALRILDAQSTTKQMPVRHGAQAQVVEATLLNVGSTWIRPRNRVTVKVQAPGVRTTVPADVTELAPGEEARVEIGIASPGLAPGTPVTSTVVARGEGIDERLGVTLSAGIPPYQATDSSLSQHQAPDWFDNAKFGIFIHWGVYSVPAWAPVGKEYAEWYWNHMNDPNDPTYQYHLQHYGANFNYDDFIPQFTAANFDPRAWVQLFQAAGAKYFVLTSKHHEGFSLFDSQVSNRNAVAMGPHQDLVQELFAADRAYTPSVHPGLYYSLPEWYNPALPWAGHPPQNPYTGQPLPYTGAPSMTDYVHQLQVPQLMEVMQNYRPDVLWCDIGYPATERSVLQAYFNQALQTGNQVTVDNRCGLPDSDFTTPEYAKYGATVVQKWESSRGLDPFSYGYNSATPDDQYMTASQAVADLVDIVSKNGNLLLDIGPRADGTIPEVMQSRLRQIGAWLAVNGESIYGTTYWWRTPQEQTNGEDLRFTLSQDRAFYVTDLNQPGSQVVVTSPVPIRQGDRITMLGYHGRPLHWTRTADGKLVIDVPAAARQSGQYAWVFKISWDR